MLLKNWDPTRACYQVTFDLPAGLDVETAAVVGDFNGWSADSHVMERTSDGRLEVQIPFDPGTRARFRYRIDGDRWENDWNADEYVANEFGGEDSVLIVPGAPPSVDPSSTDGAKRPSAKKATAKKATAKKATAKKAATKKATAKKAATKKATAKKAAAEKAPAKRKAAAKKAAPRKAATEPAGAPPAEAP